MVRDGRTLSTFPVSQVLNGSYGDPYMVFSGDNLTYSLGEFCDDCCKNFANYDAAMTYTFFLKLLDNSTGCIMSSSVKLHYGLSVVITENKKLEIRVSS